MKLSKLKLMNYRCFGSEEQVIPIGKLTTFIGNNSAGKTAALSALNCLFSENSTDRILQRSDFHLPKDTFFVALSRAKESVSFTFCKRRTNMSRPLQRHKEINEFFDLLQRPGVAEIKNISE